MSHRFPRLTSVHPDSAAPRTGRLGARRREAAADASRDAGIGAALGFTYEELQINRAGRLSERQLARLSTSRSRGRAFTVVMAVLVVVFVVLIVSLLLPKLTENQAFDSVPIAPIVIGVPTGPRAA